ncbi:MAG: response regulator transcription factor [Pseudomonadales bacterium]|nr:response regulator transcription factor [Pseudomonadales bacterium]
MKYLIADDHALYRDGLAHLLSSLDAAAQLIETWDFPETLVQAQSNPDIGLLLLDLRMPGMQGMQSVRELISRAPGIPILVISAVEDPEEMQQVLQAGVSGYIPKSETANLMRHAIQLVLGGGVYVPLTLLHALQEPAVQHNQLTPRQMDVLKLMVGGSNNKEIARDLNLSVATVKAHLGAIFRTLDVSSRAQAMVKAGRLGLLQSAD